MENVEWEFREQWYLGMAEACEKRYKASLALTPADKVLIGFLGARFGDRDDGREEASKWRVKAELATRHIRSW